MRTKRQRNPQAGKPQAGFTLLELLIAMTIMVVIMVALLDLFDRLTRLSRAQLNLSDMQQGLRVAQRELVRNVRMAGRGGLDIDRLITGTALPNGLTLRGPALDVRNNLPATPAAREIAVGSGVYALEGTDVLIFRGVVSTPVYVVDYMNPASFVLNPPDLDGRTGQVTIAKNTITGIQQDLGSLQQAIANNRPEALLFVDAQNPSIYGVAQLNPAGSSVTADSVTLAFTTRDSDNSNHAALYKHMSWNNGAATFADFTRGVVYAGLLEEYRYYIREAYAVDGDASSELVPKLSYARVYPGTEIAYLGDAANLRLDIADNVFDLQVALGLDTNADGVANGQATETADGEDDDWLYNAGDDTASLGVAPWNGPLPLLYARISTLVRAPEPDPRHQSPELAQIEDHDYTVANPYAYNLMNGTTTGVEGQTVDARQFRRQILETVVDLRSLR